MSKKIVEIDIIVPKGQTFTIMGTISIWKVMHHIAMKDLERMGFWVCDYEYDYGCDYE